MCYFGVYGQAREFLNPTILPGIMFLLTSWVKSAVFSHVSHSFSFKAQLLLGNMPSVTTAISMF